MLKYFLKKKIYNAITPYNESEVCRSCSKRKNGFIRCKRDSRDYWEIISCPISKFTQIQEKYLLEYIKKFGYKVNNYELADWYPKQIESNKKYILNEVIGLDGSYLVFPEEVPKEGYDD